MDEYVKASELTEAIVRRDLDQIAGLLERGLDPNLGYRETPLITAIGEMVDGGPLEAVVLLVRHGARGGDALLSALMEEQYSAAHVLLAAGCDVNFRGIEGDSPLRYCVERGDIAMAETLLRCGATKTIDSAGGPSGMNALGRAAFELNRPMVKLLLKWGANPMGEDVDRQIAREHLPCRHDSNAQAWDEIASLLPARKRRE